VESLVSLSWCIRQGTRGEGDGDADYLPPSAVALHCCKAHAKINRKIENSTLCKIVTHEDFNLKLGTRDYVADITHRAPLGRVESAQRGLPPK